MATTEFEFDCTNRKCDRENVYVIMSDKGVSLKGAAQCPSCGHDLTLSRFYSVDDEAVEEADEDE